jgi:hypothetical protein
MPLTGGQEARQRQQEYPEFHKNPRLRSRAKFQFYHEAAEVVSNQSG